MTARYLLDTNAIIYLMNGRLASPLPEGKYCVSVISEIELLSFPGLSGNEEQRIHELLQVLERIPLSDAVCEKAIRLRRDHRLKIPDAIIVSSALIHQAILLTNDQAMSAIDGLSSQSLDLK